MYMLDTDICSYIIRERPASVLEKFQRLSSSDLCISVITQAELLYEVARSNSRNINHKIVEDFTSRLLVLPWNSKAAQYYAILRSTMEEKGRIIGNMDMMIASHALSVNASVVTNNVRHFAMVPELTSLNWL